MKKHFFRSAAKAAALLGAMEESARRDDAVGAMAAMGSLVGEYGLHPETVPFVVKTLAVLKQKEADLTYARFTPNGLCVPLMDLTRGLEKLAGENARDPALIPVFKALMEQIAAISLGHAVDCAERIHSLASPHWAGNFTVPEHVALTGFYKGKLPLKQAVMETQLELAGRLAEKGDYDLAALTAARAKGGKIPELEDLNCQSSEKYAKYSRMANEKRWMPPPAP